TGQFLFERSVAFKEFNAYGSRRGNHEVMVRGTFGNIRLRNRLAPGTEGGVTVYLPDGEQMSIYEASLRYQEAGVPLIVLAGKEYGSGSSRDWAAKGTALLGVKAVIAQSFERIHRSNLIGMGVLPLEFKSGENAETLGLNGREEYDIHGISTIEPGGRVRVAARREDGSVVEFEAVVRIDSAMELSYYREGGILQEVLREFIAESEKAG